MRALKWQNRFHLKEIYSQKIYIFVIIVWDGVRKGQNPRQVYLQFRTPIQRFSLSFCHSDTFFSFRQTGSENLQQVNRLKTDRVFLHSLLKSQIWISVPMLLQRFPHFLSGKTVTRTAVKPNRCYNPSPLYPKLKNGYTLVCRHHHKNWYKDWINVISPPHTFKIMISGARTARREKNMSWNPL